MRNRRLVVVAVLALSGCGPTFTVGMKMKPAKAQNFLACTGQDNLNKMIELTVSLSISESAEHRATVNALFADGTCVHAAGNKIYSITAVNSDEVEVADAAAPTKQRRWAAANSFDPPK